MSSSQCRSLVVTVWLVVSMSPSHAQIPQTFTNLKVLPAGIPPRQLVDVMVSFSKALDVRCVYCHVGEDSPTLTGVDFASDERAPKKTARLMIALTRTVNASLALDLGPSPDGQDRVRCVTCHRGASRPQQQ
jgi:hypothetical protein